MTIFFTKFRKNSLLFSSYQEKKRLQKISKMLLEEIWFQAVCDHDLKKMKIIFAADKLLLNVFDQYQWSALMYAARDNNVTIATWLLQVGADLNFSHQKIIHKDGSITPAYGFPFTLACASSSLQVAQLLYKTGKIDDLQINDSFLSAITDHGYETLEWLMQIGANIESRDHEGRSAFLLACRRSTLQVVKLLYATGKFKIDEVDNQGNNALLNAVSFNGVKKRDHWYNQLQIVPWLIELGIDVTHKNNEGNSAFIVIARHNLNLLELLYATKKININEQNNQGSTALMNAIPINVQCLEKLISWGADISLRNKQGQTALDYALFERKICKYNSFTAELEIMIPQLQQAQLK